MSEETKAPVEVLPEKPKRQKREKAAIVPLPAPVEIRLGSLAIADPKEMIHRAAQLADALAEIINQQKLYVVIKNKKYVMAEGWTTMGAMVGVTPIEESCEPLPDGKGYHAKVKLIRLYDGMQVGGASAICRISEKGWNPDDDFATHSKAITRATGKAFRLSFAWIMKLAGFEATPAAEIFEVEGSEEESEEVLQKKLAELRGKKEASEQKREERQTAKVSAFITWPEAHNGHKFLLTGKTALFEHGITLKTIEEICAGRWNEREGGWFIPASYAPFLRKLLIDEVKCPLIEQPLHDMTGVLEESIGNAERRKSATPIS